MIPSQIRSGAAFFILSASALIAQPYHNDAVVGGVQTLEVEGDLSLKQYGGGLGGDLKVTGDAHVAVGGISLPNMPSGVTGTYYGTHRVGTSSNVGEFVFEKTGDNTTGNFVVPLGMIGDWVGAAIQLEILTGPHDYDSGGAQFTIIPRRIASLGGIIAVDHRAVGGGRGVKLHGKNHGMIHFFLEYDPEHPWGGERDHKVTVKISTIGTIHPDARWHTFSEMTPILLMESMVSSVANGDDMTHSLNAGNIALNGNVAVPSGKALTVGNSAVLTEAEFGATLSSVTPPTTTAWTSAFVARGTVSSGASLATGSSVASGSYAIANGSAGAKATGAFSYANGNLTVASGSNSYANGFGATASGGFSRASGSGAIASGSYATASGLNAKANGNYSMASGHYVEVHAFGETAFGSANLTAPLGTADAWGELDYLFHVGNGTAPSSRSDALTILKNGQTTLTNKNWKLNVGSDPTSVLNDPPSTTDSGGNALVIEGHAVMKGKVIIEQAQGDISMGIYQ
jgi:hypothetical protein